MPTFQVLRRVDAFVDYVAHVEAASADEAVAHVAKDEAKFAWSEIGVAQFDARCFVVLDQDGDELDSTRRGDF